MHLRVKVLDNLGCGLSVASLCTKLEISYDELCSLAQEDNEVYNELKRWYPKYDFLAEKKEEPKLTADAIKNALEAMNRHPNAEDNPQFLIKESLVEEMVEDKPLKTKRKSRKTKEKPEEDLEG